MTGDALVIAVPSKGRIEEEAHNVFVRAGLAIKKNGGARDYSGRIEGLPGVAVRFLSSGDIATALESGAAHLGITGLDLVRERTIDPERSIALLKPLGFGRADVVVAVPRAWIDVVSMADLAEAANDFRHRHHRHMRVATKFGRLARAHFARYNLVDYRIVESAGATEAAPANGQAEFIVDITTTGATLKANGLKIVEDGLILASQSHLCASLCANWNNRARSLAAQVLGAIETAYGTPRVKPTVRGARVLASELFAKLR